MDTLLDHFFDRHPQKVAELLESCSADELIEFANQIDAEHGAFLPYLSSEKARFLLEQVPSENIRSIVNALPDTQLASIVKHLPIEKRSNILQKLSENRAARINRLLDFNDTQVGYYAQKPKLVLFEHNTVSQALNIFSNLNEKDLPIYLVNTEYQFVGAVNIVKLIKARDQNNLNLKNIKTTQINSVSGSSPLEAILEQFKTEKSKSIVVTGKNDLFLGVISINVLKQRAHIPSRERKKSAVEEYLYFSEMLWSGLGKFWGALK